MYIEKKEEIIAVVLEFEKALKTQRELLYVKDAKHPSLQLWTMYMKFLGEIILLFEGNQNWKNLERVYEKLEIEAFKINQDTDFNESKSKLENYIERIKRKLEIKE